MDKLQYLLDVKNKDIREIYDTWVSLGSLRVDNKTKIYNKDSIFRIDTEGTLKNAIVYCNYSYTTDPNVGFEKIDWSNGEIDSINNKVYFYQGVASPNFTVILTPSEYETIDVTVETNENFMPFKNCEIKTSSISISDEEYHIIAAELGIPFLREEELEYNRSTIIDICIKPAVDQFYSYFPKIIDEPCGFKSANAEYEIEYHNFPENPTAFAYKGLPYMTIGAGGVAASSSFGAGAFNFLRTEFMAGGMMGGTNGFGGGIRYSKPVPGFSGAQDYTNTMLLNRALGQGYLNAFRREYERDIYKNGKKYIKGYTSIGGHLNIHWLCMDTVYEHIDYWMLPEVRKLCTAYALRNLGMLRSLIKPGDNSTVDYSLYTSRADALEQKVLDNWAKNPLVFSLALKRGGL